MKRIAFERGAFEDFTDSITCPIPKTQSIRYGVYETKVVFSAKFKLFLGIPTIVPKSIPASLDPETAWYVSPKIGITERFLEWKCQLIRLLLPISLRLP